jgi:hypothetical protein
MAAGLVVTLAGLFGALRPQPGADVGGVEARPSAPAAAGTGVLSPTPLVELPPDGGGRSLPDSTTPGSGEVEPTAGRDLPFPTAADATGVVSPTPLVERFGECTLTAGAGGADIYAGPDRLYGWIGTLLEGESIQLLGQFAAAPGEMIWYQAGWQGVLGWIEGSEAHRLIGDCGHLPIAAPPLMPPDITALPGGPAPGEVDYVVNVSGEPGTVHEVTQRMPSPEGDFEHHYEFVFDIPEAEGNAGRRAIDIELTCSPQDTAWLVWSLYRGPGDRLSCGSRTTDDWVLWNLNRMHVLVMVETRAHLSYTLTITVRAYTGR